jgi:RNA polymerase sigma-70 factor, ECF subfamily
VGNGLLVRIAGREARRRGGRLSLASPELDDLAYQAAADALIAITAKLGSSGCEPVHDVG